MPWDWKPQNAFFVSKETLRVVIVNTFMCWRFVGEESRATVGRNLQLSVVNSY